MVDRFGAAIGRGCEVRLTLVNSHGRFQGMVRVQLAVLLFRCDLMSSSHSPDHTASFPIETRPFGTTASGQRASLYILKNKNGMEVSLCDFGATVVAIRVPDSTGKPADVALGFDDVQHYAESTFYFGGTIGRYANRIARGTFSLDGRRWVLGKNEGENTLHGGIRGFNKQTWESQIVYDNDGSAVRFSYLSPDGQEGFPGTLTANVLFALATHRNELRMDYSATTDKPTVLNLTNHTYFNLAGEGAGEILSHRLTLHASRFTPVNEKLIPTGTLQDVSDTPLDFRQPAAIGSRIGDEHEQLKLAGGYDHNWVIDRRTDERGPVLAARVTEPRTGRVLEVLTTEPGIQFYSGNFLDGTEMGKSKQAYPFRTGFCLETQHFPDSPNHPSFPSTVLMPGKTFQSTTIFRFSVE